jgi:hypothetical protein
VSLPTIVARSIPSASRKEAITSAWPGGERSASGFIGSVCDPIGQSGTMQRKPSASAAAGPSQRLPLTSRPWTKRIGSPVPPSRYETGPAGSWTWLRSSPMEAFVDVLMVFPFACR